jgi:aromatic-amino-acid transaminase
LDQWQTLADSAAHQGFVPFIDIAYQGFGDGLDEDAAGLRVMAETVPEMFVASSCSKNFAVYRDRVGMAMAISESAEQADITQSNLMTLSRRRYSMPPDHGAAVVRMVLHDSALREEWRQELAGMRNRMLNLRQRLATTLREKSGSDRHGFIAAHRGMFSLLGATPEQVARLLKEHGIYMTGDSRINVAGLLEDRIEFVADAILDVGL